MSWMIGLDAELKAFLPIIPVNKYNCLFRNLWQTDWPTDGQKGS